MDRPLIDLHAIALGVACSRLSDSGEDAKVKGTRKVAGAGKCKKEAAAFPLPSFLPFYFRVRTFSIKRTPLSRNLEQATLELGCFSNSTCNIDIVQPDLSQGYNLTDFDERSATGL